MQIHTIGFTKKPASEFFELLRAAKVRRVLDIRLNNVSQLAGFAKRDDLAFFVKELLSGEYVHETRLAPTQEMIDKYRKHRDTWKEFELAFTELMRKRRVEDILDRASFSTPTVLLCSEATADRCHRLIVADYLGKEWGDVHAVHL